MTFRWPWRLKLTSNHQTNIFIWFLDPKNPLKMVSFVILTYFIFPIWPLAAILNFSKRSIVRIGHHVRNWSLDTIESFFSKIKFYSLDLSAESKMAAGGHIGKMKYLRITNDTIFNGFLGSRNQIKMFVWWFEVKFSLQGHLKVI